MKVRMQYSEHNPPHFHVWFQGRKIVVEIKSGAIVKGTLPRKQRIGIAGVGRAASEDADVELESSRGYETHSISEMEVRCSMCAKNPDYEPEIYMVSHYRGMKVDCYFTNGDIRRYDITPAVKRGGCYAPLANVKVLKKALTVYEGTLAFDLTGKRDPYEIIDFCVDTVYEKSVSIVPLKEVA